MALHIALLGDSIFDNRAYTGGAPDVVGHLSELLPPSWQATLCAVDGSTAANLVKQPARVPPETSHLAIAVGGTMRWRAATPPERRELDRRSPCPVR
jgi:hypothetical protein